MFELKTCQYVDFCHPNWLAKSTNGYSALSHSHVRQLTLSGLGKSNLDLSSGMGRGE
jgi:hypothetical protein